jgi:hypothetical protein
LFHLSSHQNEIFINRAPQQIYSKQSQTAPVSSANKTDRHNITEILLKVALNTINQSKPKNVDLISDQTSYTLVLEMEIQSCTMKGLLDIEAEH